MLIYIQEVIWIEDQGEGTPLSCRTSHTLELILAFHYDWENETILPGALRHFKWYQNMYSYFLYILHCIGFQWILGDEERGGEMMRPSVQGVDHPVCCVLDAVVTYARDSSCWFLGGPFVLSRGGGGGADILAPGLQFLSLALFWATHGVSCSVTSVVVRWAVLRGWGLG